MFTHVQIFNCLSVRLWDQRAVSAELLHSHPSLKSTLTLILFMFALTTRLLIYQYLPHYWADISLPKYWHWPLFGECPRESPFYITSTLRLVLGHSIGQHWLKSPPPTVDANSSLITNWGWFEKSLSSCLGGLFCLFAEELLKSKEACLLAISSFRRFWNINDV